jgi:hypothetical protein
MHRRGGALTYYVSAQFVQWIDGATITRRSLSQAAIARGQQSHHRPAMTRSLPDSVPVASRSDDSESPVMIVMERATSTAPWCQRTVQ